MSEWKPKVAGFRKGVTSWKKFEYFNFPVNKGNDFLKQVNQFYDYLKWVYIQNNKASDISGEVDY